MPVKDSVTELHTTELYKYLDTLNPEYAERITTFVREITPLMASIKDFFPYYTRHDAHHGFQVVQRISQCLLPACSEKNNPAALTAQETFLLIAAAYAHDLGMAVFPQEEERLLTQLAITNESGWKTNPTLQNHLRQNHSRRGGEYVEGNAEKLGVPRNLTAALDLLMRAHNYSIPQLESELQRPFAAGQKEGDLAQLAVIVCVADAIEFSDTRVIDGVIEKLSDIEGAAARVSYNENMKHICTGDSLAVTDDGRIVVSGAFSDAGVLALAHRTFDQMEEWIQGYSDIDLRCRYRRLKVRGEPFQRDLILSSGNFHRLGVRLNKRSVIDLIASNAIWRTHKGIALRELVQNAVEACRYRAHHSAPSDRYSPEVKIKFDRETHTITVTDNGCGMSERTILNNLLTVGSSRSHEAAYMESDYSPIARFGVGFWSVFTISDIATVSTAAFESYKGRPVEAKSAAGLKFEVQLTELKDFTVFSETKQPCGTTITLKLKPEIIIDETYTSLKSQLLCSAIPLKITIDNNEEIIPSDVPDITEDSLFKFRRHAAEELGIKLFQYRESTSRVSISLGLAYRLVDGTVTLTSEYESSMLNIIENMQLEKSAICGFSVPIWANRICIDLSRVGAVNSNALSPKGFEFSIDRQQLNNNTAKQEYLDDLIHLIHKGYRAFLRENNSYNPKAIYTLQRESLLQGGNVYDTFTDNELNTAKNKYPDLISTKLIPIKPGIDFNTANENSVFLDINELTETDATVICLQATRNWQKHYFPLENIQALQLAYAVALQIVANQQNSEIFYLASPDRTFSMLFDNTPTSGVAIATAPNNLDLCLLVVKLRDTNFDHPPINVIPNIQGRWSGAVYWRDFVTPDNKPYLFLGRHRVLIKNGSPLQKHLISLSSQKRFTEISELVNLLREDESGYEPYSIKELLLER